jgi:hypothetical protein
VNPLQRSRASLTLAVLTAGGLSYDAYVHLHLAAGYDAVGTSITQGGLFRIEAGIALLTAAAVLISDKRLVWLSAGLTGLAGLAAVVLYRYVDVGAIGPIPDMFEPIWYADKTWSAVAEGAVGLLSLLRASAPYVRHARAAACTRRTP